jgi:hypothetical protein
MATHWMFMWGHVTGGTVVFMGEVLWVVWGT